MRLPASWCLPRPAVSSRGPHPGSVPLALQTGTRSLTLADLENEIGSAFRFSDFFPSSSSPTFRLARDRRKGGSLLSVGIRRPSLHVHSCVVDGDCTTGGLYSIYWAHPHVFSHLSAASSSLHTHLYSRRAHSHTLHTGRHSASRITELSMSSVHLAPESS